MKKSLFFLVSLFVILSMALVSCQPATTATTSSANGPIPLPANPKTVTGGWSQEPDNIVPYYTNMSYAVWIAQLTLAGLGEWNDKGEMVPELASEIPTSENGGISADGLTITWKLKPDLKWSDGEPLTSADVKFTWESNMDPLNASVWKQGYDKIESITTPDDTTVVIKFSTLYPPWPTLFTQGPNNSGSILPKHILEGKTGLEKDPFIHWPTVASGPWVIADWVAGDHMQLLPNPNFYAGRAKLDQVLIKFIPDPETALAALQAGDIDWYPDFAESDISTLKGLEPKIHADVILGSEFEQFIFNMISTTPTEGFEFSVGDKDGFCPLKDYKVRKAIILGINRQGIVDTLLEGATNVPASEWTNSSWYNTNLTPEAYDPDQAMALLEEAGYTDANGDGIREGTCNGEEVKLSIDFETTNKQLRVDVATVVQSDLAKIGVEFKPNHSPAGTFFATYSDGGIMATGNYDMAGYTTGFYPDPYPAGGDWDCNTSNANHPIGTNYTGLCDPTLVELMAKVNASVDPVVRKAAIDEVQKYLYDNAYVVMMYSRTKVHGYVDRMVFGPWGFLGDSNWNSEVWDVK